MGLSFRKSISLGKGLKVNVGKGGVGLSAGVKGARVSVNKNGVGGSIGANGVRYSKRKSFKSMQSDLNNLGSISQSNTNLTPVGNTDYTRHLTLIISGFICLFIGFLFPPLIFIYDHIIIFWHNMHAEELEKNKSRI